MTSNDPQADGATFLRLGPGMVAIAVPKHIQIREDSETRRSGLGAIRHIRMWSVGWEPLTWRECWEAFARAYPGRWAVQVFPPADKLVDGKAVYHLFVLEHEPEGMNLWVA